MKKLRKLLTWLKLHWAMLAFWFRPMEE